MVVLESRMDAVLQILTLALRSANTGHLLIKIGKEFDKDVMTVLHSLTRHHPWTVEFLHHHDQVVLIQAIVLH